MAIGYGRARNLMRQLGWNMRVTTICDSVDKIVLFHPLQDREYTVRLDSGRKLMRECVMQHRIDSMTAILEYDLSLIHLGRCRHPARSGNGEGWV